MSKIRLPLPYFGSTLLWKEIVSYSGAAFRIGEHYQRRTQRNRTIIANAQGRQTLSVPLLGGKHQSCPMPEVRISYEEDWRRQHWLSLKAAYGSAPFWPEYGPELEILYLTRPEFLWDWNWSCISWAATQLKAGLVLAKAEGWIKEVDTNAIQLTGGTDMPAYGQVFTERTGWLDNLSILDLILCQGPSATSYLSATPV